MVLLHKLAAQIRLVCWVNVIDVEHFRFRPDVFRRIAMAAKAPVHVERVHFVHQGHLVHLAVASGTSHALVDVNAVVEIDKVGEIMYACPGDRLAARPAIANGLGDVDVIPDLRVARHAGLGRG